MDRSVRALGAGAAVRAVGMSLFGPFLALYYHNVLGLGYGEVGLLLFVPGMVALPLSLVGGLVADRWGRRRVFLASLVVELAIVGLMGESMALGSLAGVFGSSLVGSVAAALGGPAISAYVSDLAEGHARTEGFTWFRVGHNAGFAVGVAAGGLLLNSFGFPRVLFLAALVLVLSTIFLRGALAPSPGDLRLGARRAATPSAGASPPVSFRESLGILRKDRVFLEITLALTLAALATGQWNTTFPLFVNGVLGLPYAVVGLGLSLNGVIVVFGQNLITRAFTGWRHTTLVTVSVGLYVAGFLFLALAGVLGLPLVAAFFGVVFVLTIGENVGAIPYSTLPSNLAPPTELGAYNGAFGTVTGLGYLIPSVEGGGVLATVKNPLLAWALLILPAVPAVGILRHAARSVPERVDRA
jgi:MFS family permease